MALGPTLTTARLVLRPPTQDDFPAFAAMMANADHVKFIGGALPEAMAWRQLATITGAWSLRGFSMFSVLERDTGQWVGRIGPWMPHGWPGTEVGWGLAPEAMGKGYGVEAATACMDWVVDHLGWTDIIHIIDPANKPSEALAARIGSTNLGPTKMPEPMHELQVNAWGQSAQQWRARRAG
ncbi:GNAT family N-acetyltransferase [Aquidulcibacter sp.]|uniref:GNAT family N-acetyltransferase n=1 Tax=Aquidulcibacter sp. TaxID=2052990 RepID=UPI00345DE705